MDTLCDNVKYKVYRGTLLDKIIVSMVDSDTTPQTFEDITLDKDTFKFIAHYLMEKYDISTSIFYSYYDEPLALNCVDNDTVEYITTIDNKGNILVNYDALKSHKSLNELGVLMDELRFILNLVYSVRREL